MNKIKGFRKMLASLLAVSMVFTSVPGTVYASEMTAEDEPVSEVREIGASEQEPVILMNDTDSEISFISVSEKDSDEEKVNALSQIRCTSFSASFNDLFDTSKIDKMILTSKRTGQVFNSEYTVLESGILSGDVLIFV